MSAPKISAMENEPRNLTMGTLIRGARALGSEVEIKLVRRKGRKQGGGEMAGEKSKPAAFKPKGAASGTTWTLLHGIYLWYISIVTGGRMAKNGVAKLFRNGRSQAVRLPREFRFEGDSVRVRRVPEGVLLEPMVSDTAKWFAAMDRLGGDPLLKKGRKQPPAPRRKIFD